ncbi:MAG: hydroxymethylbilane synthase [Cytophagaceae bacterium]|nr:hydroxymethylbilane synthase [Cytophagaceae bacterium]
MNETIKIGTRGSKLALWQAQYVAALLQKGGFKTELVTIETKGDKILNAPFAEIGTKGLFTEELEYKLIAGEIDIAVHSAKDMQSELQSGLNIIAFTKREEANDVLVSFDKNFSLANKDAELVVGTSSTRRRATLMHCYPHVKIVDARGNLQTRMKKMEDGKFQAMILAYAGVHRMNYHEFIVSKLPLNIFTPAVGQGSIAIESSDTVSSQKREQIRKLINDEETENCLLAERAFLRTLQGGCSVPVFALARLEGNKIHIEGGIISLDGKRVIREKMTGEKSAADNLGTILAEKIFVSGGKEILEDIKRN